MHRDGAAQPGKSGLPGCPAREKALKGGLSLPQTHFELREIKKVAASGFLPLSEASLAAVKKRAEFHNLVLNQLVLIWVVRRALPWSRFEDPELRAAFRYSNAQAHLYGRTWASNQGHQLYLALSEEVIGKLKVSSLSSFWVHLHCSSMLIDSFGRTTLE